jgi:nucleotide-binding universal stress UspA family protein
MYLRILVPIDATARSDAVLRHGLRLAREQRAGLRIILVLESPWLFAYEGVPQVYADAIDQTWRRANQVLDGAVAEARQAGIEVDAKLIEANGQRIPDLIAAEAERWPADLIVIGTHGRHGIGHLLFGSVAESVVHATSVPVLLVHASLTEVTARAA